MTETATVRVVCDDNDDNSSFC